MTQTETTSIVDTTPGGIYELCDAKRHLVVQQLFDDGDDRLEPLLGLIDAIGDKNKAASKMIEAPIPGAEK